MVIEDDGSPLFVLAKALFKGLKMRMCRVAIFAVVLTLAFATTSLASDFVLEFYLQKASSSIVPIKEIHITLTDSNKREVLNERLKDEVVCKTTATLEDGSYSLLVEDPKSRYFGTTSIFVTSQSSSSMLFLLDNMGVNLLENVHSCDNNLACAFGDECSCDDRCICKYVHNKSSQSLAGRKKDNIVSSMASKLLSTETAEKNCVAGQPTCCSSCAYSNLYETSCEGNFGVPACGTSGGCGGAWGLLGLLGLIAIANDNSDPGPITEEPVLK